MKAFVTGSRAYGKPREDSDLDLVVLVSEEDAETISMFCEDQPVGNTLEIGYESTSLRFGNLNLILLTDHNAYKAWQEGTDALKVNAKRKPVSRETAIRVLSTLRKKYEVD